MATGQRERVWGVKRIAGVLTLVARDGDVATVVEIGDGVVRIRIGRVLPGGRFAPALDTTVESLCMITPVDAAEPPCDVVDVLPVLEDDDLPEAA